MHPVLDGALALWRAGLSVIPVKRDGSKAPAVVWREYQTGRAGEATIRQWFASGEFGIGVVCGAVSGNLLVFDFEDLASFDRWAALVPADILAALPVAETPGGGRHVYLRLSFPPPAGQKLACVRADDKSYPLALETRGEGNYVIAPGSPADCHESGRPYRWVRRGWLDSALPEGAAGDR
jgi:hypothetical protein